MHEHISVIGLGKLGMCLAACAASRGAAVVGLDSSLHTVALVNEGSSPVFEPSLAEMIAANRHRLVATHDYSAALAQSDMTFIVVPTPSEESGGFSLRYIAQAAEEIGKALKPKRSYHLVVVVSTVLPGSTEFGILPVLEAHSAKRCGADFGLCYSPEFVALGNVIQGMLRPDFALIGESDPHAGNVLEGWYRTFCENSPPVCRMNFVNAELAKIAVNTYVTAKITFANMLSAICERLPGANIDTVTSTLGRDSRIGGRYLTGGMGYGGPCFPRDNHAMAFTARMLGCNADLAETTDAMNRSFCDRLVYHISALVPYGRTIALLGLAYKPGTNVVEESQPLVIAKRLAAMAYRIIVFDACALGNARLLLKDQVTYGNSVAECLRIADAVVIAGPDKEFQELQASDFPERAEPIVVLDCWRIVQNRLAGCSRIKYVALGVGGNNAVLATRLAQIWQAPGAAARSS